MNRQCQKVILQTNGLKTTEILALLGRRLLGRIVAAIAVDMGRTQGAWPETIQGAFPGIQLFLRERITLAGLLITKNAALYRLDNG